MNVNELKRFVDAMVAGGMGNADVMINEGRDGEDEFGMLDVSFDRYRDTDDIILMMKRDYRS